MAKEKKKDKKAGKEPKDLKKARGSWRALEDQIDREFKMLVKEGYMVEELETLRWDYRYAKLEEFKLSQEHLEYFVAEAEALAGGWEPPPLPGGAAKQPEPAEGAASAAAGATAGVEYQRKSQVDLDLVEKYLDRRVGRETRSEMESLYKEAFGEDLQVPSKLDLVDISYHGDITSADAARKLSKAEVLGVPDDAKPEAKKEEAKVEAAPAAPAVKRPSAVLGFINVARKGVPQGPTRDAKWSVWNPFRFWLIPRRLAGTSKARYYILFFVNLVIFLAQFVLILVPFAIRGLIWTVRYVWARFLRTSVTSKLHTLAEKAAVPPAGAAEAKKESAPTKSS